MTIYGYIRVSTITQNLDNQEFEIKTFAKKQNIKVDKWIKETVSTRKNLEDRKLYTLLQELQENDIVISTEISRLGRNMLEIMSILKECLDKKCQIWTLKENYRLGSDLQSKVLAFAFSLSAEIERQLISQRTKESLKRLKESGRPIGRPKGIPFFKLRKQHKVIRRLLNMQISKVQISKILDCSYKTLTRYVGKNFCQDGKYYY